MLKKKTVKNGLEQQVIGCFGFCREKKLLHCILANEEILLVIVGNM